MPKQSPRRSRFSGPIVLEDVGDGRNYRLYISITYLTDVKNAPYFIVVPEGFVTDFASIPRGLWNIFPTMGEYNGAAIVHDYLYRETHWPQKVCDDIFLEAMQDSGVSWLTRTMIYRALRLFGGRAS